MKKICGWCDKILPDVPGNPDAVTVGLCDECDRRIRAEEGLPPSGEEVKEKEQEGGGENIVHREPDVEHRSVNLFSRSV